MSSILDGTSNVLLLGEALGGDPTDQPRNRRTDTMNAPTTDAKKLAHRELLPTRRLTHWDGINPSDPG